MQLSSTCPTQQGGSSPATTCEDGADKTCSHAAPGIAGFTLRRLALHSPDQDILVPTKSGDLADLFVKGKVVTLKQCLRLLGPDGFLCGGHTLRVPASIPGGPL